MNYDQIRFHGIDSRLDCVNHILQLVYGIHTPTIVERLVNPQPLVLEAQTYTSYGMDKALLPILWQAMGDYIDIFSTPEAIEAYNLKMAKAFFSNHRALTFRDLSLVIQGVSEEQGRINLLANFTWLFYRLVHEARKLETNTDFYIAVYKVIPRWWPKSREALHYQRCGMVLASFDLARSPEHEVPTFVGALVERSRQIATQTIESYQT